MTIDWAALGLVAVTTVVAAIAIVGIFSLGVVALTCNGNSSLHTDGAHSQRSPAATLSGYACVALSGLLVLYGLYLIIPQFH